MNSMIVPWLAEVVIISWKDVAGSNKFGVGKAPATAAGAHPPAPSELLATFIIFGSLSLAQGTQWQRPATLFAWGLVLATFMNFVDPTFSNKLNCTGNDGSKTQQILGIGNQAPGVNVAPGVSPTTNTATGKTVI